jgi:uncharacterized protein (TIGR03083 family)
MTDLDDELAALLALDALEPDEQADGELRVGTFPAGLAETSLALAELVVAEPPAGLRTAMLGRATRSRAAGRPVNAVPPCEPAEAFARTVADLHRLLESLTDSDWNAPAHAEHGRVRDLVAHLVGVERLSVGWLQPNHPLPVLPDHVAATRPVVDELADTDPGQLPGIWHWAAQVVSAAAATGDPARSVTFHDLQVSVPGLLVIRTFELWAHAMDIASATGRPALPLDPSRMTLMSSQLMAVLPEALAYRGSAMPGRIARFVLTGEAGGCYTVRLAPGATGPAIGEPDFTLVADAVELCRLAARRLRPDELAATVEGDQELAELVLADLDAFARD